jgi:hypothetical protein
MKFLQFFNYFVQYKNSYFLKRMCSPNSKAYEIDVPFIIIIYVS